MNEVLYQFISMYYMEILAVLPMMLLLIGLYIAVGIDSYIQRDKRRIMLIICTLVLSLIVQNYLDYLLTNGKPMVSLRKIVDIYGYSIRPVILLLFLYIVSQKGLDKRYWILIGINGGIHLTALFSRICFTIDDKNVFQRGLPVLRDCCLIISVIFMSMLLYTMFRDYRSIWHMENLLPVFAVFSIIMALVLDFSVRYVPQPVSFLTISITISSILYYIWLHFQFVREHESALAAEQRIQIMMSQIQPHFLFNTLATIRSLCTRSPKTAALTIDKFSRFLRQNMDTLTETNLVSFAQELEHVKIYTEIEMLMFPYIHMCYDIEDDSFLLPSLTVQPLVENAIRHGVRARGRGQIDIVVRKNERGHIITIADNGMGFDVTTVEGDNKGDNNGEGHIGIRNVRERLEKQCRGSLRIASRMGEGTSVTIFIPEMSKEHEDAKKGESR